MATLRLSRIDIDRAPCAEQYNDHTIFQTREWLKFVSEAQHAEPVTALVRNGNCDVGIFTGLVVNRLGIRILGSPFPGWTTSYMGFNLDPSISRAGVLAALEQFAFRELACIHVEVMDRRLTIRDFEQAGYKYRTLDTYEVDLSRDEEELFIAMDPACRRCIRKGVKNGVRVEAAFDASFVDEFYAQLVEVFVRQKLAPTYSKERVRLLVEHLVPTGRLLLARVVDERGTCIATGIFPAVNGTMYFWGGASRKEYLSLRPNEALHWYAMRYWKVRGITKYDMGGEGEYKRKYGGQAISVPWGRKSKYPLVDCLRGCGLAIFKVRQHIVGSIKHADGRAVYQSVLYLVLPMFS
jgi:hypothetical protein